MASLSVGPSVSAADRLSFTVFIAIALHAIIITSEFIHEDATPAQKTIEITLSRYDDEKKPEKADFLAETNQLGSGTALEKAEPTSTTQAIQHNAIPQHASSPAPKHIPQEAAKKPVIVTKKAKQRRPSLFDRAVETEVPKQVQPRKSMLERSLEIAELEANLDQQQQKYARRPRISRFSAASTMKAADAGYISHVVKKIERIGSLNFPTDAGKKLYGTPRMSISIYADGAILDVLVLQSSGSLVLDARTKEIIYRAGPFAPFPKDVRKERDVIELIRTFSYSNKGVSAYQ